MSAVFKKVVVLLLLAFQTLATTDVRSTNVGPVTAVMENLAFNTASITDEIYLQFYTKMERTTDSISGNIEVIISSAMDQLSAPIFKATQKLALGNCQQIWSIDELRNRIGTQLSNCTQPLNDILETFQNDADSIASTLQTFVTDIVNLPEFCQLLDGRDFVGMSFASSSSCFVEKIAVINQNVSQELNRASMTLVRTRQLAKLSVADAEQCTNAVVDEVINYLDETFANC